MKKEIKEGDFIGLSKCINCKNHTNKYCSKKKLSIPNPNTEVSCADFELNKNIKTKEAEFMHQKIDELFGKEKPVFQSLGCGVHNGIRYTGTLVYAKDETPFNAIITNERRYYTGQEITSIFGLKYKFDFEEEVLDSSISNDVIQSYLKHEFKKIPIKEIFYKLKPKHESLMDYHDKRIHSVIVCDTISDHHLPVFNAKGLSYWNAPKGSGKTKEIEYYGQTSFNPIQVANISAASLFRIVASTKCTPLVDNLDNLPEEHLKALNQYMQVCYKRGGKYSRVEENNKGRKSKVYDVFSSFKFNNVSGIHEITLSRCNEFLLMKTNSEKGKSKVNPKDKFWKEIRDQLYISGLEDHEIVKETYENLKVDLNNRDLEITEPILAIAKLVDKKTYDEVLSYFQDSLKNRKIKDLDHKWDYILLNILLDKTDGNPKYLKSKELVEEIAKVLGLIKEDKNYKREIHKISIYIGKFIKSIPLWFENGRLVNGATEYLFKKEDVVKVIKVKEYDDLLDAQTTLPNSTNSTNSIISTNSTKEENMVESVESSRVHTTLEK
tara:strand:- start:560 stop:2212 length:1653 start_codon:yes stop_codon:yes gene_type:complete